MRILLVEDDAMIGTALRTALEDAAYAVEWVTRAGAASDALARVSVDAVLLDLGLPDRDGFELLSGLRDAGERVPVVIVTARDDVDARVRGLDLGADDYVVKPFAVKELLARLRAVVRRRAGHAGALLTNGDLSLDPGTREVRRGDIVQRLSAREFSVLQVLLLRPGVISSRPDLERHVYGPGDEVQSNAIEFLIHALRRKLGADAIRNVRGAGWMVERAP
ncbi:MAG TPA: response regulator transcription factor [Usitatibacter sp.]|jgi:two-component system OmpR family response regulator|nr:response regulator transcription factor [Usitatibacter sp.]